MRNLIHILIDSSFVATIAVVQSNFHDGGEDNRNSVRHIACPGGYYAAELPPSIVPMTWEVPKHPLRPATRGRLKSISHVPIARSRNGGHGMVYWKGVRRLGCIINCAILRQSDFIEFFKMMIQKQLDKLKHRWTNSRFTSKAVKVHLPPRYVPTPQQKC